MRLPCSSTGIGDLLQIIFLLIAFVVIFDGDEMSLDLFVFRFHLGQCLRQLHEVAYLVK